MSLKAAIVDQFKQVAEEHNKKLAPIDDELELLESGLDSLCLAVIVARLEDALGVDPFTASEETPFPVTFGDFVRSYENAVQTK